MKTRKFDVCISGSGVVGRTLALLLARDHLRVALVEESGKAAEPCADVRAWALNARSRDLLQSLRCWPSGEQVTPVTHIQVLGDQQGEINFHADANEHPSALAWMVDAQALLDRLDEALGFQPLVSRVNHAVNAPLTVICEGRDSATRQKLGVEFGVDSYRQAAIAARLQCERPHMQQVRQWFGADGSVLALLPLDGENGSRLALTWSVDEALAHTLMTLDDDAFAAELTTACHHAIGDLKLCAPRQLWPLRRACARNWTGRVPAHRQHHWALAGDAAHNVHPLAGHGLNFGLADAGELASILRERETWRSPGDPHLLRRYERARKFAIAPMFAATDGVQRLFALDASFLPVLRNGGMQALERCGPLKNLMAQYALHN